MFLQNEPNAGLLRYELFPGEPVDEFTYQILNQNAPKGVLMLGRETTEGYDHLLLPVSGVLPLKTFFSIVKEPLSPDKFLEAVQKTRDSLRSCMIPENQLVLRPEYTWVRPETGEPVLLVLPTPLAKDLSLSWDDYEVLVRRSFAAGKEESAKPSAKPKAPGRSWRQILRDYWEDLD